MAKYFGKLTRAQQTEIEYLENAIKICKRNLKVLGEKAGASLSDKGKTKAQKVEEQRVEENRKRYAKQLQELETNMTDIYEARGRYKQHCERAAYHIREAEKLQKKWGF